MSKFQEYIESIKPYNKEDFFRDERRRMGGAPEPTKNVETDPFKIITEPFGSLKRQLLDKARTENINVVLNDVKIWRSPVGNPSGLHDFQYQLIREKFKKSGDRFAKKLNTIKKGDTISIEEYRNITRDRGKWVVTKKVKVGSK